MNSRIVKPLIEFLNKSSRGVYIADFQFHHINYVSEEIACTVNAGINYNNTTFIIEIDE